MDWGAEVERLQEEYTRHLDDLIRDMWQAPDLMREIAEFYNLPEDIERHVLSYILG
jgi:hypothetical protein